MKIVDVQVKEVYVLAEFSINDLNKLKFILDHMTLTFDGNTPFEEEARSYLIDNLYPTVVDFLKENTNAIS